MNHLGEQLNCDVPEIELRIYGIGQALLFSCCTGFKHSIMYLSNILRDLKDWSKRSFLSFFHLFPVSNSMLSTAFILLNVSCNCDVIITVKQNVNLIFCITSQAVSTYFLVIRKFILFSRVNCQVMWGKPWFSNCNFIIRLFKVQISFFLYCSTVCRKMLIFLEVQVKKFSWIKQSLALFWKQLCLLL